MDTWLLIAEVFRNIRNYKIKKANLILLTKLDMKKWLLILSSRLDKTVLTWKWRKELVHQSPWDLCVTLVTFLNSKVESYLHEVGDALKELDDECRIRLGIESTSWRRWKKKKEDYKPSSSHWKANVGYVLDWSS